jgi:hypothetical protein
VLSSGIVNAAVNGRTKVFQAKFFERNLKNDPVVKKFAGQLKSAFADRPKAVNSANMRKVMHRAIGKIDLTKPLSFAEIPSTAFKEFEG